MDNHLADFLSSHDERLDKQLQFVAIIDEMTHIMRRTLLLDKSRRENDAEHSWHIAVMALLFSEYAKDAPDVGHSIKMLICHDLIEIYAGDTFAYDVKGNETKAAREKESADKLFSQLPEDQGHMLRSLWEEFDNMNSVDSRFANCLDRLQPFLHNTLTAGHTWKESRISKAAVLKRLSIVQSVMPRLWPWVLENVENGVKQSWIL